MKRTSSSPGRKLGLSPPPGCSQNGGILLHILRCLQMENLDWIVHPYSVFWSPHGCLEVVPFIYCFAFINCPAAFQGIETMPLGSVSLEYHPDLHQLGVWDCPPKVLLTGALQSSSAAKWEPRHRDLDPQRCLIGWNKVFIEMKLQFSFNFSFHWNEIFIDWNKKWVRLSWTVWDLGRGSEHPFYFFLEWSFVCCWYIPTN